jgi:hypothetical protein
MERLSIKKYFLLMFFVFCISGCATNLREEKKSTASDTLQSVADEFSWNFGKVKEGEVLKHDFILKNNSSVILNLKDATSSCGCTVMEFKKKVLQPQEATSIEVKFNSKGYQGPTEQFVYVNTDSIDKPVIRFIIKADVVK